VIALKMLNQQMQGDQQWVQRFYNEAKACSRLQHPNTIRMFDFGQTQDGRLFMTMEFLDGVSLRDALQRGPLAAQRVVKILIQCCASLAEAHSIGIIHRDIKPDNVFLLNMAGSPDFVKLLDFSVAKLLEGDRMKTQAGVVFGTPQYMSPEQGRGLPLDARSDLYALGVLAYEMLVGTVPFNDENPMIVIQMQREAAIPPMPETIPYPVQMIVRRALEKDPARRYQSSGEMMQHCQQVFAELNGGGVSVGGGGVPRTMIAPNMQAAMGQPQMGQPPQQAMGGLASQQPSYQAAGAQAKTMIAQQSPFVGGGMPQQQQPAPQQQQGPQGFVQSSPMQKTIVAQMAPQIVGGQLVQQGQPMMQPQQPQMMQQQPQPGGANKTVLLQPTDGIVSVARQSGGAAIPNTGRAPDGATPLFWAVSLIVGIAIGVVAYVIVLQV
jgi:hypothetical protein